MENLTGLEIAVIGLSCRFPGASNIYEFWDNLLNGRENIEFFTNSELENSGIKKENLENPDFVRSKGGTLKNKEFFDAHFFGYTTQEAQLLDPQTRLFLECAWEALENAAYVPNKYDGAIGLFCGATPNLDWEVKCSLTDVSKEIGPWASRQLYNKDFLPTRISNKINLKGPSVSIYTACSTSLFAVHIACQSLLFGESDMALAGGVTINTFSNKGYVYREGLVLSKDGHCRAFDAKASGTALGEGVGVVVLKKLIHAVDDKDHIYAVIKGSAANNDGSNKTNYQSPSANGQAHVIKTAFRIANVRPQDVSYIEAHGTGTKIGDSIEIEGLRRVFGSTDNKLCGIGSVKTNIGHLDSAAGISGLIKTILSVYNKKIPQSVNFSSANPDLRIEDSSFYVVDKTTEWESGKMKIAGVSSFGIGGTNVHVVVQEFTDVLKQSSKKKGNIFLISAKTESALKTKVDELSKFISDNDSIDLHSVAYTLQSGREDFEYRISVQANTIYELHTALTNNYFEITKTRQVAGYKQDIIFMFPGGGNQYVNMGRELYLHEPLFKRELDTCFSLIKMKYGMDIKTILYSETIAVNDDNEINQIKYALPLLFSIEYALAKFIINLGIKPKGLIGHSIGEYVAACLSGVFDLESALGIVMYRAGLMQKTIPGGLLVVQASILDIAGFIEKYKEVSLAAINSPVNTLLAGKDEQIQRLGAELEENGFICRKLRTSHSSHSVLMDPILAQFEEYLKGIKFSSPKIPFISNLSGDWADPLLVQKPSYWVDHLRNTVNLSDGLKKIIERNSILIEIGPCKSICNLIQQHDEYNDDTVLVNLLKHPNDVIDDEVLFLKQLGVLWQNNVKIDWASFYNSQIPPKTPLPTYPFERERFWIDREINTSGMLVENTQAQNDNWLYAPTWKKKLAEVIPDANGKNKNIVVFLDQKNRKSVDFLNKLLTYTENLVCVHVGNEFKRMSSDHYVINPEEEEDYSLLFEQFNNEAFTPDIIIHALCFDDDYTLEKHIEINELHFIYGYISLLNLAQQICNVFPECDAQIVTIANNVFKVFPEDICRPEKSILTGISKVIPQEINNLSCKFIELNQDILCEKDYENIINEFLFDHDSYEYAYRNKCFFERTYDPIPGKANQSFRIDTTHLNNIMITGGLGGIGLLVAEYFIRNFSSKILVIGRRTIPKKIEWDQIIRDNKIDTSLDSTIRFLKENESYIFYRSCDVKDGKKLKRVVDNYTKKHGVIQGVVHSAGLPDYNGIILSRTAANEYNIFNPKIEGTINLYNVFADHDLEFMLLFSSNISYFPIIGQSAYASANIFLNSFADYINYTQARFPVKSIAWDAWSSIGLAVKSEEYLKDKFASMGFTYKMENALSPKDGIKALDRALNCRFPNILVTKKDIQKLISVSNIAIKDSGKLLQNLAKDEKSSLRKKPRPIISSEYVDYSNDFEKKLQRIWCDLFNYSQIGIKDNFFELGGDSIKAMTCTNICRKEFEVNIPLNLLYKNPTIEEFAKRITTTVNQLNENVSTDSSNTFTNGRIKKIERREYYPLSPVQEQIYFRNSLVPDSVQYNINGLVRLDINRSDSFYTDILNQLITRHEIFSYTILQIGGKLYQRSVFNTRPEIHTIDITNRQIMEVVKEITKPFSIEKERLIRVYLLKSNKDKYLYLDTHHIICDGYSLSKLCNELKLVVQGKNVPCLNYRFVDYLKVIQINSKKGLTDNFLTNWSKVDFHTVNNTQLYFEKRYPINKNKQGYINYVIGREEYKQINTISKVEGISSFVFLLSVFQILISKYSKENNGIIGTIVDERYNSAGFRDVIGLFVNTLPLYLPVSISSPVKEYMSFVNNTVINTYENINYPYSEFLKTMRIKRYGHKNPLFNIVFSLLKQADNYSDTEHLSCKTIDKPIPFELIGDLKEYKNELIITFSFNLEKYSFEDMKQFVNHFDMLLHQVLENTERKISDMNLLIKTKVTTESNDIDFTF